MRVANKEATNPDSFVRTLLNEKQFSDFHYGCSDQEGTCFGEHRPGARQAATQHLSEIRKGPHTVHITKLLGENDMIGKLFEG